MRTSQIADLFFPSLSSCTKRLQELRKTGYLKAIRRRTTGYYTENIWMITRKGLVVASEWLTYHRRQFSSRNLKVDSKVYNHDLQIVEVFVELVKRNISSVDDLLKGNFLETRSADVPISSYRNHVRLRPDARFKHGEYWYWVEIDRGTERLSSIMQKINRYKAYMETYNGNDKHIVVFLTENGEKLSPKLYFNRIKTIQWNVASILGAYSQSGRLEWYTFDIEEGLDILCQYLLDKELVKGALYGFVRSLLQSSAIEAYQLKLNDQEFVPGTVTPTAWLGLLKNDGGEGQFYVVENLMGGASGGLFRLGYFSIQQHEFLRKMGGLKPRLLVLVNHPRELEVIHEHYPQLIDDLRYLTWPELEEELWEDSWEERGYVVNE